MTIMPGASWRPITVPGGVSARTPGRAVVLHVAASEATSLFGFFNGNTAANSHFYVAKSGVIEQYIDTRYQAWTSMTANKNTIGVETQGGVTNPDGEPWTAAQVESLARICAWAHTSEGVALAVMPNSLPTSRGIGYHRLGIDPWRIAGGEVWSSSRGKLCPGAAKIAQVPQIVARAQQIVNGSPTPLPAPPIVQQEDDVRLIRTPDGTIWKLTEHSMEAEGNLATANALAKAYGVPIVAMEYAEKDPVFLDAYARRNRLIADLTAAVGKVQTGGVDPAAVVKGVLGGLNGTTLNVGQPPTNG